MLAQNIARAASDAGIFTKFPKGTEWIQADVSWHLRSAGNQKRYCFEVTHSLEAPRTDYDPYLDQIDLRMDKDETGEWQPTWIVSTGVGEAFFPVVRDAEGGFVFKPCDDPEDA